VLNVIITIVIVLVVAFVLLAFVFPGALLRLANFFMRRGAGMVAKTVTVDGVEWPYLEGGPADAPTLVVLHGFGADKDTWVEFAKEATQKFRVIAPDLPAFGDNTKDPNRDYTMAAQAKGVRAFAKALNLGKLHLSGNSMGGGIAIRFGLDYSDDVASLTLYGPLGVRPRPSLTAFEEKIEKGQNPFTINSVKDVENLLATIFHEPPKVPGPILKAIFNNTQKVADLHENIFQGLIKEFDADSTEAQYGNIKAPTLLIWGAEDAILHVSCADVLKTQIPDVHTIIMEETGHCPMTERTKESVAAQVAFMESKGLM